MSKHMQHQQPDLGRDYISAVARAFAVLRCYRRGEKALGNKEIAARAALPKSTVARLTATLTRLGYLEYLPAEEKYALGIGILTLGQNYLAGLDIREQARPLMQELADYAEASVALAARDGDQMVFLEICHGNQLFRLGLEVGERVPRGTTALGRAGHVALSAEERERATNSYLNDVPKQDWPKVRRGLDQALRDYEQLGFCFSLGDWNENVFAVGVPLAAGDDGKVFAFGCFGPAHAVTRERLIDDLGPRLVRLRDRIAAQFGGR